MERFLQKLSLKLLTGESRIALRRRVPSADELREKFEDLEQLGLYLHIPFCRQICPYCPYNKDDGERIVLSDRGAFWLHAFEDMFSIDYVSRLWGVSERDPWPEQVLL